MPDDRGLAQRLRAYESRIPDDDPPDIRAIRRARTTGWPMLLAGAVSALAAVGVAIAVLLNAVPSSVELGPSPSPWGSLSAATSRIPSPSAPTTAESATAVPIETPAQTSVPSEGTAVTWTEGVAVEGRVHDVIWLGDAWLAAGGIGNRAALWTSSDGLNWQAGPAIGPEPVPCCDEPGGTGYWITTLIDFDDEILAFGWTRIGCCDGGRPTIWRSSDAVTWTFVDTTGTAFDTYHFPTAASRAPTGDLVVIGTTGLGSGTTVFTSPDGTVWEEHLLTASGSSERMDAVAASPNLLVGVGFTAMWSSTDGRAWRTIPPPEPQSRLSSIAWDPEGERFVAGGSDSNDRPAVWLSTDAANWSKVSLSDNTGGVGEVAAGDGLIVAGGSEGAYPDQVTTVWVSSEGYAWQAAPLRQGGGAAIVATRAGRAVAWIDTPYEPDAPATMEVWAATRAD
jgi:hypothetical protein